LAAVAGGPGAADTPGTAVEPAATSTPVAAAAPTATKPRKTFRQRRSGHFLSMLLIFVGAVFIPLSVITVWASTTVTNTDRFTTTLSPLATNPAIQAEITAKLSSRIDAAADINQRVTSILPQKLKPLAGPISSAADGFIYASVDKIVTSPQFATIFTGAIRHAHQAAVYALQGGGPRGVVSTKDGAVTVDLTQLVTEVKTQLVAHGLTFADKLPSGQKLGTVTVFQSKGLVHYQWAFRIMDKLGLFLPLLTLLLLIGGILLARNRRRAVTRVGAYAVLGMIVLLVLLSGTRAAYLNAVPADKISPAAAAATFDIIIRFLRQACATMLTLGLLVFLVGFFSGPSRPATAIRGGVNHVLGRIGAAGERAGVLPIGLRLWFLKARHWLWAGDVVLIAVLMVFVDHDSGVTLIWWAVLGVVLLAIIETIRARTPAEMAAAVLAAPLPGEPGGPDALGLDQSRAVEGSVATPPATVATAAAVAAVVTMTAAPPGADESEPTDTEPASEAQTGEGSEPA
jgi:hypothetical protein